MGYRGTDYVETFARTILQKEANQDRARNQQVSLAAQSVRLARENRAMRRDMIRARMSGMQQVANIFAKTAQVRMQQEQLLTDKTKTFAEIEQAKAGMRLQEDQVQITRDRLQMEAALGVRRLASDIMKNRSTEAYNRAIASQATLGKAIMLIQAMPDAMEQALELKRRSLESLGKAQGGIANQFGMGYDTETQQFSVAENTLLNDIYQAGYARTLSPEQFGSNFVGYLTDSYGKATMRERLAMQRRAQEQNPGKEVTLPALDRIPETRRNQILSDSIEGAMTDYWAGAVIGKASGATKADLKERLNVARTALEAGELTRAQYNQMVTENIIGTALIGSDGRTITGATATASPTVAQNFRNSIRTMVRSVGTNPETFEEYTRSHGQYLMADEGVQQFGAAGVMALEFIRGGLTGVPWMASLTSPSLTMAASAAGGEEPARALAGATRELVSRSSDYYEQDDMSTEGLPLKDNPPPVITGDAAIRALDALNTGGVNLVPEAAAKGATQVDKIDGKDISNLKVVDEIYSGGYGF